MTKTRTFTALAAAAVLGTAAIAAPQPAEAHWRGGGAVAAGIIGGLAAGALVGAASGAYAYGPGPGYYYGGYGPGYYGGCYWTRQRFWDGWGWRVRPVRVCR